MWIFDIYVLKVCSESKKKSICWFILLPLGDELPFPQSLIYTIPQTFSSLCLWISQCLPNHIPENILYPHWMLFRKGCCTEALFVPGGQISSFTVFTHNAFGMSGWKWALFCSELHENNSSVWKITCILIQKHCRSVAFSLIIW